MAFRVGHDVAQEILLELVAWRAARGRSAAAPALRAVSPAGITTTIGFAFSSAIMLSMMNPARPTVVHASSLSPAPCSR